ncbi:hypothetical protein D9M69_480240 [compost metagenome]
MHEMSVTRINSAAKEVTHVIFALPRHAQGFKSVIADNSAGSYQAVTFYRSLQGIVYPDHPLINQVFSSPHGAGGNGIGRCHIQHTGTG